jgi:phosphomannomutase
MGIFKAYDIRGRVPGELDEAMARKIGGAAARFLNARTMVVGRDVRLSSPAFAAALADGIRDAGCDVVDIGLCTTPMTYFTVAKYGYDGAVMTTASHNPPEYNGFKISREKAIPLSESTGIRDIERLVSGGSPAGAAPPPARGRVLPRDVREDYIRHLLVFARDIRPLTVVVDTANGCVGTIFNDVAKHLPLKIIPLFFEPDGRFPNHEPDPLKEKNLAALKAKMKEVGADLGAAFDGDGDRCMFVDETWTRAPNDLLTALIARDFLSRRPGAAVVYDLRSSWVVRDEVVRAGGRPIRERVGHAFIKRTMREHNAVLGGELSGHYYFGDNFFADSGLIAFLSIVSIVSAAGQPLSKLIAPLRRYASTGEINFHVEDKDGKIAELRRTFADGRQDDLDGVTVEYDDWWFNVRKSNTEPLLRLNLEAKTPARLAEARERLIGLLGTPEA